MARPSCPIVGFIRDGVPHVASHMAREDCPPGTERWASYDGEPLVLPARGLPAWAEDRRVTVYVAGRGAMAPWLALMRPQDRAFRTDHAGRLSVTFKGAGQISVRSPEAVGLSPDLDALSLGRAMQDLWSELQELDHDWPSSLGALARTVRDQLIKTTGSTPSRWRGPGLAAMHAGPMVIRRGGADYGVAWDRTAAYLQALSAPTPHPRCWTASRSARVTGAVTDTTAWRDRLAEDGDVPFIVTATVWVDGSHGLDELPGVLPVRTMFGVLYPVGRLRGTWTSRLLDAAIATGRVVVEEVHDLCIGEWTSAWRPFADYLWTLREEGFKRVAKGIYTRAVGQLASVGGWQGRTEQADGALRFPGSPLWWTPTMPNVWRARLPQVFQPDVAAFLFAHNAAEMLTMGQWLGTRAVAAHVDCWWFEGTPAEARNPPAGWATKGRGPLRFYGVGIYRHGDTRKAMGAPAGTPMSDMGLLTHALHNFSQGHGPGSDTEWGGVWPCQLSGLDAHAVSQRWDDPELYLGDLDAEARAVGRPPLYWSGWTTGGFPRDRSADPVIATGYNPPRGRAPGPCKTE